MLAIVVIIEEDADGLRLRTTPLAAENSTVVEKAVADLVVGLATATNPVMAAVGGYIDLLKRLAPYSGKRLDQELEVLAEMVYGAEKDPNEGRTFSRRVPADQDYDPPF